MESDFNMKYIKKPIPITAIQWNGLNADEIFDFMQENHPIFSNNNDIIIHTLEGDMCAPVGSFIIKGVDGEFYPCRKDIFERSYTAVHEHLVVCDQCQKGFSSNETKIFYDELNRKYKYWSICPYCGTKNDWEV